VGKGRVAGAPNRQAHSLRCGLDKVLLGCAYLAGGRRALSGGENVGSTETRAGGGKSNELFPEAQDSLIALQVRNLSSNLGGSDLPAIAAGRLKSEKTSQGRAREILDYVLDEHEIWLFDFELWNLGTDLDVLEAEQDLRKLRLGADAEGATTHDPNTPMAKLREHPLALLLEPGLKRLDSLLEKKDWKGAREQIHTLRRYTQERSPRDFAALLDDPKIESWRARIAALFIPVLGNLRRRRQELRQPLYLESEYYLARSLFLSFEPEKLKAAHERVRGLRESRLSPNPSNKEKDLTVLTLCLELEALARLEQMQHSLDARFNLDRLVSSSEAQMKADSQDGRRRPKARAAALVSCGLLERRKRRADAARDVKRYYRVKETEQARARYREMQYYNQALELVAEPTTHCYLAECLLEAGRTDDAKRHVRQALAMAPLHVLANGLSGAGANGSSREQASTSVTEEPGRATGTDGPASGPTAEVVPE
jgi:tetratricopeptide (TPR) repeat protein